MYSNLWPASFHKLVAKWPDKLARVFVWTCYKNVIMLQQLSNGATEADKKKIKS